MGLRLIRLCEDDRRPRYGTNSAAYRDAIAATSHDTFLTVLVNYGGIGLTLLLLPWLVIIGRASAGTPAVTRSLAAHRRE